ncbi:MAG: copper amine oxidase N-terminal domain-containing protein [Zhenhengia sp.]|jgi:hypothetical protein|uniref:copper amine oxidase N-terminal domain-containing protein n=1 Tax=Zhenhengia sp. TaxID=2944208 RepID=UPI0029079B5C|nr:copper amine oxidase N-terminal domain-containing protein [Clostridiales bacterium]MDU6854696.1 copper amine oxidase N-terminal domain-containing protein [Clostridiales bacterium]MDU6974520.1 copper amine oxidase N-terminal domain-containing protein [Clostridiales bacterium]
MNKKIQKIMGIALANMLVLTPIPSQASALANPVSISLDQTIIGQGYISDNGSTMIPLRVLSEKLKYNVNWDNVEQTATLKKGDKYIEFTVDYHNAKVNDGYIQLSSKPEMKNNTVYLPLRVVADTLGLQISYANRTAYLSTSGEPIKVPTVNKQVPLEEVPSLLLGNGYKRFGIDNISYNRHAIGEDGKPYQISFAQVVPEKQLVTLSLHENNSENLEMAKLILSSLVPTKANELYNMISTQEIIPLTIIEADGYQIGILAEEDYSSLDLIFDGSQDKTYIKTLINSSL